MRACEHFLSSGHKRELRVRKCANCIYNFGLSDNADICVCVHANNVYAYITHSQFTSRSFVPLIPARARIPAPERVLNV